MIQHQGKLTAAAPFDLAHSLRFIGDFTPTHGEQSMVGRSLTKAIMIQGTPIVFRVTAEPLSYTLYTAAPASPTVVEAALDRVRFYLSLDDELGPFYEVGQRDPHFMPVLRSLYGYHQVKFLTPFENACWAVLTQRNRIPAARAMKSAIVDALGAHITVDGTSYPVFPEPEALLEAGPARLEQLIHHTQKADYLMAVAQAFFTTDEQFLRTGPYEEVAAWLRGIKGIGEWSAAFVLVRGLGRMEHLPAEPRLLEATSRFYAQPVDAARLHTLAEPYGAWRGYWAHYLRAAA
jgi:DNA-3-methyladenine glycosylase II